MLDGQADLESPYSYVIEILINLIKHLQYLLEYAFKVSPSHMVMDNKESKGRGTLL